MSINIKVCDGTISIKRKGASLAAYQIDKGRRKTKSINLPTDEFKVLAEKSSGKVDLEKITSCCSKKKEDIAKKKESSRHKLKKFEKRYKYLEKNCYKYMSQSNDQNQSLFRTNDSQPTNHSVRRLIELTQQVLQLEQEVNAVLFSKSSRRFNNYNGMGFLLKLNEVKIRLLDEFDLNSSNQIPADNSHEYPPDDSTVNSELQQNSNECSGFSDNVTNIYTEMCMATEVVSNRIDEDDRTIDMMTEKIIMDLKKFDSEIVSNREIDHSYESKKTDTLNSTTILSDIPKVPASLSANSLLFKEKPPAYLKCKKYKRLNIDFAIHELSAIHEVTDSDIIKDYCKSEVIELGL